MKIIIIGNGFDLNLGLKTSYKDFIESDYFISLVRENNSLATYLVDKTKLNNWVDIEQEITQYSIQFKENDEFLHVRNDFEALKTALTNYLKEAQTGKINQNSKAFEMIKNELDTANAIYNFNYTNSVFRVAEMLNISDIENKHSYVHGSIENMDIIFGVEDDAGTLSNHIFFKKAFNPNYGKSDISKYLKDNKDKHDFVVFGHSLGITDSSYFSDYINSLKFANKQAKLKFYYYGDIGYHEMIKIIDKYTRNSLTMFKDNTEFIPIDSSESTPE
ncbi:AbiH family protein [Sulfurimonas sp. HSL-1716]|uniref:AbiH family protein n=1 Tax=Hydrocurvibacter sulfurireducens TaxID=3131937 RepID=UPI0031F81AD4